MLPDVQQHLCPGPCRWSRSDQQKKTGRRNHTRSVLLPGYSFYYQQWLPGVPAATANFNASYALVHNPDTTTRSTFRIRLTTTSVPEFSTRRVIYPRPPTLHTSWVHELLRVRAISHDETLQDDAIGTARASGAMYCRVFAIIL